MLQAKKYKLKEMRRKTSRMTCVGILLSADIIQFKQGAEEFSEYVCVIFSTLFTSLKQLKKRIMERTAV